MSEQKKEKKKLSPELSPAALEARRAYQRERYRVNREAMLKKQAEYWERKAAKNG